MKKLVFLYLLFCVSVLCCFAEEWSKDDENIATSPFFSYSSSRSMFGFDNDLTIRTPGFGFSMVNPVLGTNSFAWNETDFDITKYSGYSFWDSPAGTTTIVVGTVVIVIAFSLLIVLIAEGG